MWELKIETNFAAAHHLLNYNGECENQHGHNWKVEVFIEGNILDKSNILMDFKVLKKHVNDVIKTLDHKDINTLDEYKKIPILKKVSVWETSNACASYFEN